MATLETQLWDYDPIDHDLKDAESLYGEEYPIYNYLISRLKTFRKKIELTRWPEEECVDDWTQGIPTFIYKGASRLLGERIRLAEKPKNS